MPTSPPRAAAASPPPSRRRSPGASRWSPGASRPGACARRRRADRAAVSRYRRRSSSSRTSPSPRAARPALVLARRARPGEEHREPAAGARRSRSRSASPRPPPRRRRGSAGRRRAHPGPGRSTTPCGLSGGLRATDAAPGRGPGRRRRPPRVTRSSSGRPTRSVDARARACEPGERIVGVGERPDASGRRPGRGTPRASSNSRISSDAQAAEDAAQVVDLLRAAAAGRPPATDRRAVDVPRRSSSSEMSAMVGTTSKAITLASSTAPSAWPRRFTSSGV